MNTISERTFQTLENPKKGLSGKDIKKACRKAT